LQLKPLLAKCHYAHDDNKDISTPISTLLSAPILNNNIQETLQKKLAIFNMLLKYNVDPDQNILLNNDTVVSSTKICMENENESYSGCMSSAMCEMTGQWPFDSNFFLKSRKNLKRPLYPPKPSHLSRVALGYASKKFKVMSKKEFSEFKNIL